MELQYRSLAGGTRDAARRAAVLLLLLLTMPLWAHDGIHEQLERVTKRIAAEPKNAPLYLQRGELYRLHRQFDEARADYARAEQLDASLHAVTFARGRMELEAGNAAAAKELLDRFLTIEPRHAEARLTRARALVKLGKDASADYGAAIAVAEPTPDLYHERAKVLAASGRIDEALKGLDEGLARLGTLASLQRMAIELELGVKRYDRALARLETLSPQSPRREFHLAEKADILTKAGRTDEARAAYREALERIAVLPEAQRNSRLTRDLAARIDEALATPPLPYRR
jgi:tetratricopeptide (TPR) repeat protein